MVFELIEQGNLVGLRRQRHGERAGGFVDHEQRRIFVKQMQPRFAAFGVAPLGAARTIHPESDGLAFLQTASGVCDGLLRAADEDLAAFNRREGF